MEYIYVSGVDDAYILICTMRSPGRGFTWVRLDPDSLHRKIENADAM